VILEVLADPGQVRHHVDAQVPQLGAVTDSGQLQQLWRIDGTTATDHLAAIGAAETVPFFIFDPDRLLAVKQHLAAQGMTLDLEVGPVFDRMDIGPRGIVASAPVNILIELAEPFLLKTVNVFGQRITGLLHGLEKGFKQRIVAFRGGDIERAVGAVISIGPLQAGFEFAEIGQTVGVIPVFQSFDGSPFFIIQGIATDIDHTVDAAGTAEDFAPRLSNAAIVHVRLGGRLVKPVIGLVGQQISQRGRHMDAEIKPVIRLTRFQNQYSRIRIGAQPISQDTSGGSAADNNVIICCILHLLLPTFTFKHVEILEGSPFGGDRSSPSPAPGVNLSRGK